MRRRVLVTLVLVALTAALRLTWIGDMEFKWDERINADYIVALHHAPFTPLAPISQHAGISHSSIFYYLVSALSFGSEDALVFGRAVAGFTALCVSAALWWSRRSSALWATFALCAVSVTLVVYCRKLWQPDLVGAWTVLAMALLGRGLDTEAPGPRALWLGAAALALSALAHMYTAACLAAFVVATVMSIWFLATHRRADALTWTAALALGAATFIPWVHAQWTNMPGAHRAHQPARAFALGQLSSILRSDAFAPTPHGFYCLYLAPNVSWMTQYYDDWLLRITILSCCSAIIIGALLFWGALLLTLARPRELVRDPLLACAMTLIVLNPIALFLLRLSDYPHYWLAVAPFALYVTACAWLKVERPGPARVGRAALIGFGALSAVAAISFIGLVHRHGGLAGEYGPAYHTLVR